MPYTFVPWQNQSEDRVPSEVVGSAHYLASQRGFLYHQAYSKYNQAYFDRARDFSFLVYEGESLAAIVFANTVRNEGIGYFNAPVGVFMPSSGVRGTPAISESSDALSGFDEIYKSILAHLIEIARKEKLKHILLREPLEVSSSLAFSKIRIVENVEGWCDLNESEEDLLRHMRKSYRSLINWGRRSLDLQLVSSAKPDKEAFMAFKALHIEVAGRQTRSDQTWQLQYEAICENHSYLILARLEGRLVAGNLIVCGNDEAYYGVGVNDRELFHDKKGIGHWPLVAAIFEAKRRGHKTFNLGNVGPTFENEKERDIGFFKKGFTDRMQSANTALFEIR